MSDMRLSCRDFRFPRLSLESEVVIYESRQAEEPLAKVEEEDQEWRAVPGFRLILT